MDLLLRALTVAATAGAGLIAGLFFFCSVALMPGLARIPGPAAVAAMQSINLVIVRASFLVVFLGAALATTLLAVLAPQPWRLAAAACYLAGVIGVTAVVNVPLNNALAAAGPDAAGTERRWRDYLSRWTVWNHVRTVAATATTLSLLLAP